MAQSESMNDRKKINQNVEDCLEASPDVQLFLTSCEVETYLVAKPQNNFTLCKQNTSLSSIDSENENEIIDNEFEDLDPKVRDAMLQMKKLDRILEQKTRKEKRVKRFGIEMRKKHAEELAVLDGNRNKYHPGNVEIKSNANVFLALCDSNSVEETVSESSQSPIGNQFGSIIVRPQTSHNSEISPQIKETRNLSSASSTRPSDICQKAIEICPKDSSRIDSLLDGIDDAPLERLPENEEINCKLLLTEGQDNCANEWSKMEELNIKLRALNNSSFILTDNS